MRGLLLSDVSKKRAAFTFKDHALEYAKQKRQEEMRVNVECRLVETGKFLKPISVTCCLHLNDT